MFERIEKHKCTQVWLRWHGELNERFLDFHTGKAGQYKITKTASKNIRRLESPVQVDYVELRDHLKSEDLYV